MNEEVRRQEVEGRREQLIENPENYPISLPLAGDLQNPQVTVYPSNASYLNRSKSESERRPIKPFACMRTSPLRPLPSAFPRDSEDTPLEYLRHSSETINPAIVTARYIQHLELSGQVTPEMMAELAKRAKAAIAQGKQAITNYNHSLQRLKSANSQPNYIPWGI